MKASSVKPVRCAIYTRVSTEHGLDQEFNSLDAQYDAASAYIKSQAHAGWALIRSRYDDGGYSGGSTDRPDLQRLLDNIRSRKIDVIVVYKVDRLTRSLADFAKLVELFDANGVSFVAVTQQFNTTTSMGRLTLNVLLSFAQFEREVTGERIRDKIAASKQKGMWMGGTVPLGYDVRERRLAVNAKEAETVRLIFQLYTELKSVRLVRAELNRRSIVSKLRSSTAGVKTGGVRFGRGALYQLLGNPIYVGEIRHKRISHPGQHDAIVDRTTWQRVQELLGERAARKRGLSGAKTSGVLTGKLFDENGERLYTCGARKGDRRYRYFVSRKLIREPGHNEGNNGWRLPAEETERAVLAGVKQILSDRRAVASFLKAEGLGAASFRKVFAAAEAVAKAFDATGSMD